MGIFRSKTKTVSQTSPEERAFIAQQTELAQFQLEQLKRQRSLQSREFRDTERTLDRTTARGRQIGAETSPVTAGAADLVEAQLQRLEAGGQATPEEVDLINEAVSRALSAGEADIARFQTQSTEQLREELAPQLGLRPGDTPILDRGARIAGEAARQQGILVNNLRGQQAETLLNFPLQRTAILGSLTGDQLRLGESARQFQQQFRASLNQAAFTNRLQLAGARATAGLGLAGAATPNITPSFGSTTVQSNSPGLIDIAGGVGGLLTGIGALGSSRAIKEAMEQIDEGKVLEAIKTLPVEAWNYIGSDEKHIGPYAEDFKEAFGVGDGKTINVIDALGVLFAGMKALANGTA